MKAQLIQAAGLACQAATGPLTVSTTSMVSTAIGGLPQSQIPTLGRNTQGVKVITPKDGEKLIEGVRIPPEEDDEETADAEE